MSTGQRVHVLNIEYDHPPVQASAWSLRTRIVGANLSTRGERLSIEAK